MLNYEKMMIENPYKPPDAEDNPDLLESTPAAPYLYSILSFLGTFCVAQFTFYKLIETVQRSFADSTYQLVIGSITLAAVGLGATVGRRTWWRCLDVHRQQLALKAKRERLRATYGS